jgi:hypothetical protein
VEAPPDTRFLFEGSMYQVQMTCACGEKYWPTQKWIHKECGVVNPPQTVTTATNTTSATNRIETGATNKRSGDGVSGGEGFSGGAELGSKVDAPCGEALVLTRTKNRRSREAYNAYQREYMRKRRVK